MTKVLLACATALVLTVLEVGTAGAGLNAAAVAQMYWQSASTGTALAARDNTNGTCQLVVTAKGLTNFSGCDVQIRLYGLDGTLKPGPGPVPAAWQGQPGGCAEGFITGYPGGRGGTILRNAFTTAPAVPGPMAFQNGEFYNTGDCKTPHGEALLWLSDAGGAGVSRTSTVEYALWAVAFDLASSVDPLDGVTPCAGGASDPAGPRPVCVSPNFHLPCTDPQRGAAVEILDGNFDVDFPAFAAGKADLTWRSTGLPCCWWCDGSKVSTWGKLRRLYR